VFQSDEEVNVMKFDR